MSILFRRTTGPTRINTVQINQSVLGYPVVVLMGKGKVQQSVLWLDGYTSKLVSTSSGKGFGGKNGTEYVYSADVIAGLCDGGDSGVTGIADVWSGQSWLQNTSTTETTTVTASNLTYTPTSSTSMTADEGVSYTTTVSSTYTDLTGTTTLSGTSTVSLKRVVYVSGQTLATGTYSVDSNNIYHFSSGNIGTTVTISYSLALGTVSKTQIGLIPSGKKITITGNVPFKKDEGVVYYNSSDTDDAKNGTALTAVTSTPSVAGTYKVDYGSYTTTGSTGSETVTVNRAANYTFSTADVNQEVMLTYQVDNSSALSTGTQTSLSFELITGTPEDSPAALLTTDFPSAALGYPGIAKVLFSPMDMGYGAQIQQNTYEVITGDVWGGGILDCNPIRCILQVVSNAVWGLGAGPVPFPTSAIDNGTGGTWGTATPAGVALEGSQAANWFAANSFFISPNIDRQDTGAGLIGKWLEAGMCAAFMSEGLMKLVAYGDTSCTGNGATWVAPSEFVAELTDVDFVQAGKGKGKGTDPVKISSSPWTEAYNKVSITWCNRLNQYAQETTPTADRAAALRYGLRIEDAQSYDFITTLAAARFSGSMRVKRSVYTRNTYDFTLPFRFGYLEPMDILSLTTKSAWSLDSANTIQLSRAPVRITRIVDNTDGTYDVTCEDLITGAHTPDGFSKSTSLTTTSPNQYADPGDTTPVFFDGPLYLKTYEGNELWIGAAGAGSSWGGCEVYASRDASKYTSIGTIKSAARLGTLNAAYATGSDPDSVNSLVVNLCDNSDALQAGTTADADASTTLCYVDGELLAYSACTVSGTNQYTMGTYVRRGLMGTSVAAHASGSNFMRLDDAILKYAYDSGWIGETIYLKFQSFNSYGNSYQDLSTLTAHTFVPGGTTYPAPPVVTVSQSTTYSGSSSVTASNGLVTTSTGLSAVATVYVTVTWSWSSTYPTPSGYNVVLFEGDDPTNTDKYISSIETVGESARTITFAVTPSSSMTDINAAVEAVYA